MVRGEPQPRTVTVTRDAPRADRHRTARRASCRRPTGRLERAYALRWTGHEARCGPRSPLDVVRARDVEEFRQAVLRDRMPGSELRVRRTSTARSRISARAGTRSAKRATHAAGSGLDGRARMARVDPLDELPHEIDPDRGFIATANDDIQPEGYPYLIAKDFHLPFRKRRIDVSCSKQRDHHDVSSMRAIQLDTISKAALETVSLLIQLETRSDDAGARP